MPDEEVDPAVVVVVADREAARADAVYGVITAVSMFFVYYMWAHMQIATNFFDLYPPGHPYIQLYQKYRPMFGTAT